MLPRKDLFNLPDRIIYLDGNSLGPKPRAVESRLNQVQKQWQTQLIGGWNTCDWMGQPVRVADKIGRLIGAPEGTLVLGDTLSIKVFQALSAALSLRPERRVILSDSGNFPSDLYMAEGLIAHINPDKDLRVVAPEEILDAIDDTIAVVMLTHVDYRTGRMHDMAAITEKAHHSGAVVIWDLAHSAGAVCVDVMDCNAEFAVGCTYKYLNGGPGAPAFIYVRPDLLPTIYPVLSGWLGHAAPFAFERTYRPAMSIERMRVGTPPVLQIAALDAALDLWEGINMSDIRTASLALSERFIAGVEATCPALKLASPRNAAERGSHVSFAHPEGYAIMQALIAHGVIGDFRAPDILRFGITPLTLDFDDIDRAAQVLAEILSKNLWDNPTYKRKSRVT